MERTVIVLQRVYWIVLVIIVGTFSLINHDLLASKSQVDLLFGRFSIHVVWFLVLILIAFFIQILISRSLLTVTRRRAERLNQELIQHKASLYDREERSQPTKGVTAEKSDVDGS